MRRTLAIASLTVFMLVAAPAGASAQRLFKDFQHDGAINPCKYSDGQLRQGLDNLPPDVQQYAPGLGDQLRAGRGNCGGGGAGGGAAGGGSGAGGQSRQGDDGQGGAAAGPGGGGPNKPKPKPGLATPPRPDLPPDTALAGTSTPRIDAAPSGSDAPWWLTLLIVLALAAGLVAVVARRRGWSTERLRPLRVAMAEAGGRTADAAAATRDRLRLGRS